MCSAFGPLFPVFSLSPKVGPKCSNVLTLKKYNVDDDMVLLIAVLFYTNINSSIIFRHINLIEYKRNTRMHVIAFAIVTHALPLHSLQGIGQTFV